MHRLVCELEFFQLHEETVASLVELGPVAIEPLKKFLLEGKPSKVFQPRLGAVKALAGLGAREVLLEYLFQEREIVDPEERLGEEAVASAAARALAAWPDKETRRLLLKLSDHRVLNGLIEALAEFRAPEAIPYIVRALEDDFYRPAAEKALLKLGPLAAEALVRSAVMPHPDPNRETPSSLKRRRTAIRLLDCIGISARHWQILRCLLHEKDAALVVAAAKTGVKFASKEDRKLMVRRLIECLSPTLWQLQRDIEETLALLKPEAAEVIDAEIARPPEQPEEFCGLDRRRRVLLRIKKGWECPDALQPGKR